MAELSNNLLALHALRASLMEATREKGIESAGCSLEQLHELWDQFRLVEYRAQRIQGTPDDHDVTYGPDDTFDVLSAVEIPLAYNLQPWNSRKGVTIFGITGTLVMEGQEDDE